MKQYIEPGSLLIVGNRAEAHTAALENGAAVLISGGFGASEEVIRLANEMELPVMSSSYDTFTIATMINKALFMNMIKRNYSSRGCYGIGSFLSYEYKYS